MLTARIKLKSLMLISFALKWLLLITCMPITAYANDQNTNNGNACSVDKSQSVSAKFSTLYNQQAFAEAEQILSAYINSCTDEQYEQIKPLSMYLNLTNDLMLAQQQNGHYSECIENGLGVIHQWGWGQQSDDDQALSDIALAEIKLNLQQCRNQILSNNLPLDGSQLAYESAACPLPQYSESEISVIKIPETWKYSKQQGICIYLHPGKPLNNENFINLPESYNYKVLAPYLVIVKQALNGTIIEQALPFNDGQLSTGEACGSPDILAVTLETKTGQIGLDKNDKLIIISGTYGFCWPGSASMAIDASYLVSDDQTLNIKHEVIVPLH